MPANNLKRWKYEAQIGFHTTFSSYLDAYRRAAEILFGQIEKEGLAVNTVSYPFLFLVRHSLELGYKLNIKHLSKYSRLEDKVNWNEHFLRELHDAFRVHFMAVAKELQVDRVMVDEFSRRCKDVEKLMKTFDGIDRRSFSFRYPVDTEQRLVFRPGDTINLLDVQDLYNKAMILLFHTADVLSDITNHFDYMNELMERELRSNCGDA